ncbi:helix-turn-helix domain-containing protein [Prochlorococcus sp. AH-736-D21]|nr:helix-turn-helix domain-containing protein [Prochlorococcus sp. AH-736-D21]
MEEIKSFTEDNDKRDKVSLKRIGKFIKEARLSKDQSVEELASDLKIGAHQLKAIEDGNEDELPEKVFVKAMIRRISQKLKIDTEFITDELKAVSGESEIEEIVKVSSKTNKTNQPKKLNPIGFGMFILISGFLGLIASSLIFNFLSESFQNQAPRQDLIKQN